MITTGTRRPSALAALTALAAASLALTACAGSGGSANGPTSPSAAPSTGTAMPTPTPTGAQPPTTPPTPPAPPTTTAAAQGCTAKILAAMSVREKAAQLVMTGIKAGGLTDAGRGVLREQHPGGLLLVGGSSSAREVRSVISAATSAAGVAHGVRPLVAADQEGGRIQRLKGTGFSEMPSAATQGGFTASRLTADATGWGRQLKAVGVTVDLAPVADVVPSDVGDRNQPIGALKRSFGSDPAKVGAHVAAFVRGMRAAGVATSVKHFPGLGRVRGNTDFSSGVTDPVTRRKDPLLASFPAGVGAGADMVMISTASYPRIDPHNRAVFSSVVIQQLVRGDLGFGGVVIADDLGAAAEVRSVPAGERATRFVAAGGDIVITADAGLTEDMIDALVAKAGSDKAFGAGLDEHVGRVLVLKQRQGLVTCG